MLVVDAIHVHYGRLAAVRGVSLTVAAGEIVCIVGPNGAGKSTTLLTIAGVLSPSSGSIRFLDCSLKGVLPEDIVRLGVSLVPEGRRIFGRLTVEENLLLGTFIRRDRAEVREDLRRMLHLFPFLQERLSSPAGKLSGGEQQQLAIARSLLTRPKLLLIDEPSLGLAPRLVDLVYDTVMRLRDDGFTLLLVEQSLERVMKVADHVHVMREGVLQLSGEVKALRDSGRLEEAYFGFSQH